jgi:hypothetical protein
MAKYKLTFEETVQVGLKITNWTRTGGYGRGPLLYEGSLSLGENSSSETEVVELTFRDRGRIDELYCRMCEGRLSSYELSSFQVDLRNAEERRNRSPMWTELYHHAEKCFKSNQKIKKETQRQKQARHLKKLREIIEND